MTYQCMLTAGLADPLAHRMVASELNTISDRFGFWVDANSFYSKLGALTRLFDWLRMKLKRFRRDVSAADRLRIDLNLP